MFEPQAMSGDTCETELLAVRYATCRSAVMYEPDGHDGAVTGNASNPAKTSQEAWPPFMFEPQAM